MIMHCRFCNNKLTHEFIDLVNSPPSNSFLSEPKLNEPELFYPLRLFVCEKCWLVQIDEYKKSEAIFNENYLYFSSFSNSWLQHSKEYVEMIIERLSLNAFSQVVEIASNDGYLLRYFIDEQIPCVGIEPTASTAKKAREIGVKTIEAFFSTAFARKFSKSNKKADLIVGNNVLAHVPDINDFVKGLKVILKEEGTITMEFPHLLNLIKENQFDTIYHEHYSYLSFTTVNTIFNHHGLKIYDVEKLKTHGGSLRIYARHSEYDQLLVANSVNDLLEKEKIFGLCNIETYEIFQEKSDLVRSVFLKFLLEEKMQGKKIAAYGAAAKGNTLLNYCGIKNDLIDFVVDASPHKQGKYLPGSHIPVTDESVLRCEKPDYIVILPWNIKDEIEKQLYYIRQWSGKFITAIPELKCW